MKAKPAARGARRTVPARGRAALLGLALVAATVCAYLPALGGGFVWDDDMYVTENQPLRSTAGLARIWLDRTAEPQYYPLVHTTYWMEYRLWGLDPHGYHLTNVLLHALGALLFWQALLRLRVPGAWLGGLLFALHPVQVESVAWVTERKNVLAGVFYLGAALSYWRFRPPADDAPPAASHQGFYLLSLALFAGALLSKSISGSLPAALLVVVWWKRGRIGWQDVRPLLPMFALGLAAGLNTAYLEKHHVGAHGPEWDLSPVERCLIAGRALWFYAAKLVWPHPLVFFYPRWTIDAGAWWQYAFPLGALAAAAVLWALRGRIGRGPLAALLLFAGTLVPALGFFDVYPMRYSFVADHFQYLATLGPLALLAAGAARLGARLGEERWLAGTVGLAVVALLGTLTWRQAHAYADARTLWIDTVTKNPGSAAAQYNLGVLLDDAGDTEGAIRRYRASLDAKPDDATTHTNLATALRETGRATEAIQHYEEALRLDPRHVTARYNLAVTLCGEDRYDEAIEHFRILLAQHPERWPVRIQLGHAYAIQGAFDRARDEFLAVLAVQPDSAAAHHMLGLVLLELGDRDAAVRHLRETVRLAPDDPEARESLAQALAEP
jgi:protein O-mannosyl-transferase